MTVRWDRVSALLAVFAFALFCGVALSLLPAIVLGVVLILATVAVMWS